MGVAEPAVMTARRGLGIVGLGAVAYAAAALVAGLLIEIGSSGWPDAERSVLLSMLVGGIALPSVLVLKLAMLGLGRDGIVEHTLAGGGVGTGCSAVILGTSEPPVVATFGLAGAAAGTVYWMVRQWGRRMIPGGGL